jgi:hypothetical protein
MITLPFCKFHALQPLDVTLFKPFEIAFIKERDTTMVKRNYIKLNKIPLAGWVDKTLNLALQEKISC